MITDPDLFLLPENFLANTCKRLNFVGVILVVGSNNSIASAATFMPCCAAFG